MSFTHARAKHDLGISAAVSVIHFVPHLFWRCSARQRTSVALGVGSSRECSTIDSVEALLARLTEARRLRTHYHDHDPQTPQRAVHSSDESQSNRQSRHSSADAIILDLEDSIAPEQKELARHSAHLTRRVCSDGLVFGQQRSSRRSYRKKSGRVHPITFCNECTVRPNLQTVLKSIIGD
jgi:hypothetical protein